MSGTTTCTNKLSGKTVCKNFIEKNSLQNIHKIDCLAVVYCNRGSKLETVILPVLLAASPLQAPTKRQFAKYVDQTDSNQKCFPDRY